MIEKATINDISELNLLVNTAYRGEKSKKGWTTEANMLTGIRIDNKELTTIIKEPNSTIFKYSEDHKILGCVLLVIKKNKLYLGMLCVNPELQNSGIGKKILKFADNYAIENKLSKIEMTVINERTELIAWYKRHGYADTGKTEPFPESHANDVILDKKIEFAILEKVL